MEVVGYKDCLTSKHRMWNKILEYKPVVKFTQVKLTKRFQQCKPQEQTNGSQPSL